MIDGLSLGMAFDRTLPPRLVLEVAERLDAMGADSLWVIEDSFYTSGVSLAAAALARTERLNVGIGIVPSVTRHAALTAMEFSTLGRLGPGRFIGGIGHGVQSWMGQMGIRQRSPLTALDEVIVSVRRLLAGETVSFDGQVVHLDEVALDQPALPAPSVLAGVHGPKSLALAGRVADGVILADAAGPAYTRWALEQARPQGSFRTVAFSTFCLTPEREQAYDEMAPHVAGILGDPGQPIQRHPHYADMVDRHADGGVAALASMPPAWWIEIGAIGAIGEVREHLEAMRDAGADEVCLFPGDDVDLVRSQLDDVATILAD
ncbi:MAG TPA: LLM class flavin-dependent oxidoreductase [Nocardioidaceae bacterium]|nr:LLM class flavin-dependent oxidoreductase [Nocardioidaceae bacterium]